MPTVHPRTDWPIRPFCIRSGIILATNPLSVAISMRAASSWLFNREIIPAETVFDPESYEAMLQIDEDMARQSYPEAFAEVLEV